MLVICIESVLVLADEQQQQQQQQRVPRNNDLVAAVEALSNGPEWNGSSGPTTNGNNTSDSLSQDDDLGLCSAECLLILQFVII